MKTYTHKKIAEIKPPNYRCSRIRVVKKSRHLWSITLSSFRLFIMLKSRRLSEIIYEYHFNKWSDHVMLPHIHGLDKINFILKSCFFFISFVCFVYIKPSVHYYDIFAVNIDKTTNNDNDEEQVIYTTRCTTHYYIISKKGHWENKQKNCQMSPAVIEDTEMHEKILVKKWYIPSSM